MLIGYSDWVITQKAATPANEEIKCIECDGEGEIESDCECCGHESVVDCGTCDTKGWIKWRHLSDGDTEKYLNRSRYLETVHKETSLLASYKCIQPEEQFFNFGLAPYMTRKGGDILIQEPIAA